MKIIVFALIALLTQPLFAAGNCESTIVEGKHTALKKKNAKKGAWEEARESCYPGVATKLNLVCEAVEGDNGVKGKPAIQCVQEATCNVCGEALRRKYEALD